MRMTLFAACLALLTGMNVLAQNTTNGPTKNGASTSVFAGAQETRSVFAKPTIKDLMKQSPFTNATGIVMVKLSDALWASKYLVTQEEYAKVAGANPSQFRGDRNPVDSVSYNDALAFCGRLMDAEAKEKMMPEGFTYTLPTQTQWEGMASGTSLENAVTSANGNRSGTAPVGSLAANGQGLYDTRGNLWQWCLDPTDKPYRVLRGAAWNEWREVNLRPEFRWYSNGPDDRQNIYGFRVVLLRTQE